MPLPTGFPLFLVLFEEQQALVSLGRPEHRLAVVDLALPYRKRVISLIEI